MPASTFSVSMRGRSATNSILLNCKDKNMPSLKNISQAYTYIYPYFLHKINYSKLTIFRNWHFSSFKRCGIKIYARFNCDKVTSSQQLKKCLVFFKCISYYLFYNKRFEMSSIKFDCFRRSSFLWVDTGKVRPFILLWS